MAHFSASILPHSLHLDQFFTLADDGEVDALILANAGVNGDFDKFRSASEYFLVPIINVSRRPSYLADAKFVVDDPDSWAETAAVIRKFRTRRALLKKSFRRPATPALRMLAREECPNCRSAWLRNSAFIHHYSCAHCGPEEEYRHGSVLICPKCKKQLRHYGKDYGNGDVPKFVELRWAASPG